MPVFADLAATLAGCPDHVALTTLNSLPGMLLDARWDREEMSLSVAPARIIEAAEAVKQAGYNFLEDVTCVDFYPAEPRFQVTYHILSHQLKQRVRLMALLPGTAPAVDTITSVWPSANFYEREVFGRVVLYFEGRSPEELQQFGEIRTPSIADLFVAKMQGEGA